MELSDKIWITRKSRINASARLERYDLYSQSLITYYSSVIIIASLWSLYNENIDLSLIPISLSILILVLSLFLGTRGFKERSISFKNCYVRLNKLLQKADSIEKENVDDPEEKYREVREQYNDILLLFENHKKVDYLRTIYEANNKNSDKEKEEYNYSLSWPQWFYFWGYNIATVLTIFTLFAVPFIIYFLIIS